MNEKTRNYPAQGWTKILFVTAALLLAPSLTAYAQGESVPPNPCEDCTSISGAVMNCAGVPLPGVTVQMVGQNTGFTRTRVTTASGTYSSGLMPADTYTVTPIPTTGYFFSPRNVVTEGEPGINFNRYPRDNRSNFDGDCKTDVAIFRPSDGTWYIMGTSTGFEAHELSFNYARLVPGDYDGDNKDDIAVFRPSNGTWYVRRSSDGVVTSFQWGLSTDLPVQADYDNDGRTDFAVYRGSDQKWYVYGSSTGWTELGPWGLSTDRLVPGDYSGDRRADPAVQRPTNGTFYILDTATGGTSQVDSFSSDFPVAAAYLTPLY